MRPPILRCALALALAVGLAPLDVEAAGLKAPRTAEDPALILMDDALGRAPAASAFDEAALIAAEASWFEEAPHAPVAAPVAPLRELALENPDEILLRHAGPALSALAGVSRGATVVDAWFLLAVPFLLPLILHRRQRRLARNWTDQLEEVGRRERLAEESALDAIVRSPYEAESLSFDTQPM